MIVGRMRGVATVVGTLAATASIGEVAVRK